MKRYNGVYIVESGTGIMVCSSSDILKTLRYWNDREPYTKPIFSFSAVKPRVVVWELKQKYAENPSMSVMDLVREGLILRYKEFNGDSLSNKSVFEILPNLTTIREHRVRGNLLTGSVIGDAVAGRVTEEFNEINKYTNHSKVKRVIRPSFSCDCCWLHKDMCKNKLVI